MNSPRGPETTWLWNSPSGSNGGRSNWSFGSGPSWNCPGLPCDVWGRENAIFVALNEDKAGENYSDNNNNNNNNDNSDNNNDNFFKIVIILIKLLLLLLIIIVLAIIITMIVMLVIIITIIMIIVMTFLINISSNSDFDPPLFELLFFKISLFNI